LTACWEARTVGTVEQAVAPALRETKPRDIETFRFVLQ